MKTLKKCRKQKQQEEKKNKKQYYHIKAYIYSESDEFDNEKTGVHTKSRIFKIYFLLMER